jgi:hypothetical protein
VYSWKRGLLVAALVFFASILAPRGARADDDSGEPPLDLRYTVPQSPTHFRAVLEELVVLGVGFGEYIQDKTNSRDFDLNYDWPSLRGKLLFQSLAFDNNRFPTNFATHPIGGYFYYGAARGNRLSILESFVFAVVASTIWEYVGEWREQASINDMIFTPVSGVPVGESLFHLGALFQRSQPNVATTGLSWLFGMPKRLNDAIDDAHAAPPPSYDALGLPGDTWHRFDATVGVGVTIQDRGPTDADGRLALRSRIVALPSYGDVGRHERWFDEGEVSSLALTTTATHDHLTDFSFEATAMPFGYYEHDVDASRTGHTTIVGLETGFEYSLHDYDRDGRRGIDRVSLVDAGLGFEHTIMLGRFSMRAGFRALVDFGGADGYALPEYQRVHSSTAGLTSVLANEGYFFTVGTTAAPRIELTAGALTAGGELRVDWFDAIHGLDRVSSEVPEVSVRDRRLGMRAWVGTSLGDHVRLEASAERRERAGRIAEITSTRGEVSFFANASLLF